MLKKTEASRNIQKGKFMPKQKEKSLTVSILQEQLMEFYQKVIKPENRFEMAEQLKEYYLKVVKPESSTQLIQFYNKMIEPQFNEVKMEIKSVRSETREINLNMEDFYKKFEALQQEYVCANEQL